MPDTSRAMTRMAALSDRSPRSRIWLAAAGGAWALLSTPLVAGDWGAAWVAELSLLEPWRALREAVDDPYIVFGALGGLSFLAIGLALLPDLRRARWGGSLLAWSVIAGAVVTPVSYLSTPAEAPTHVLWGSEGPLLILVGIFGVVAAVTARGWAGWVRVLLAATLPVLIAGLLATGYYPHGCLATLGIEAVALIIGAPRAGAGAAVSSAPAPTTARGA